jgi:hypothetical protein
MNVVDREPATRRKVLYKTAVVGRGLVVHDDNVDLDTGADDLRTPRIQAIGQHMGPPGRANADPDASEPRGCLGCLVLVRLLGEQQAPENLSRPAITAGCMLRQEIPADGLPIDTHITRPPCSAPDLPGCLVQRAFA